MHHEYDYFNRKIKKIKVHYKGKSYNLIASLTNSSFSQIKKSLIEKNEQYFTIGLYKCALREKQLKRSH